MRKIARIIVNPTSGRARAQKVAKEVAGILVDAGMTVTASQTQAAGDASSFAKKYAPVVDVIVSIGGDGTLNEVVDGVLASGARTPIAVIPAGTANVVAAELELPKGVEQQALIAVDSPVRRLDLGRAGDDRIFTMCAGIGFDANIVDHVSRQRTENGITVFDYYLPTLALGMQYKFPLMRVEVDGEIVDEASTFTMIGNMRRYAGPFSFFAGDTHPDDGMLNVCCLHGTNPLDLVRWGWGAFFKQLKKYNDVSHYMGKRIRIEAEPDVLVQIDGECGGRLPMTFEVLPAAAAFCVTANGHSH